MQTVADVERAIPHGRMLVHYDEAMAALFGDACWTDYLRTSGTAGVAMVGGSIVHDLTPRLYRPRPVMRAGRVVGFVHGATAAIRPPTASAVARLIRDGILDAGGVIRRDPDRNRGDSLWEDVVWAPLRWCDPHDDRDTRRATGYFKRGLSAEDPRMKIPRAARHVHRRAAAMRHRNDYGLGDSPDAPWVGTTSEDASTGWYRIRTGKRPGDEIPSPLTLENILAHRLRIYGKRDKDLTAEQEIERIRSWLGPDKRLFREPEDIWEWDELADTEEAAMALSKRMSSSELSDAMARVVAGLEGATGVAGLSFAAVAERWWTGGAGGLGPEHPDAWSLWRPDPRNAAIVAWRSAWGEVGNHVERRDGRRIYDAAGRMPGRPPRPVDGRKRAGPFMGDDRHPDALSMMMQAAMGAWDVAVSHVQGRYSKPGDPERPRARRSPPVNTGSDDDQFNNDQFDEEMGLGFDPPDGGRLRRAFHPEILRAARGALEGSPVDPERIGEEAFVAAIETISALTVTARGLDCVAMSTERIRTRIHAASHLARAATIARLRLDRQPWIGPDGLPMEGCINDGRRPDGLALYAPPAFDPRAVRDAAWRDHVFTLDGGYARSEIAEGFEWARWTAFGAVAIEAVRAGLKPDSKSGASGFAGREMADWMVGGVDPVFGGAGGAGGAGGEGEDGLARTPLNPIEGHVADAKRAWAHGGGFGKAAETLDPMGIPLRLNDGLSQRQRRIWAMKHLDGDVRLPAGHLAVTGRPSTRASTWGFVPRPDAGAPGTASSRMAANADAFDVEAVGREASKTLDGTIAAARRVSAEIHAATTKAHQAKSGLDRARILDVDLAPPLHGPTERGVRFAYSDERLDAFGRREGHGAAMLRERRRRHGIEDPASMLVREALAFVGVDEGGDDIRAFTRPGEEGPLDRASRGRGRAATTLHGMEAAGLEVLSTIGFVRNTVMPPEFEHGRRVPDDCPTRIVPQSEVAPRRDRLTPFLYADPPDRYQRDWDAHEEDEEEDVDGVGGGAAARLGFDPSVPGEDGDLDGAVWLAEEPIDDAEFVEVPEDPPSGGHP